MQTFCPEAGESPPGSRGLWSPRGSSPCHPAGYQGVPAAAWPGSHSHCLPTCPSALTPSTGQTVAGRGVARETLSLLPASSPNPPPEAGRHLHPLPDVRSAAAALAPGTLPGVLAPGALLTHQAWLQEPRSSIAVDPKARQRHDICLDFPSWCPVGDRHCCWGWGAGVQPALDHPWCPPGLALAL